LNGTTQASALVPFINDFWTDLGCPPIQQIIVPCGPGSFTALRVTLATAVGLQMGFPQAICYAPTFFEVLLDEADVNAYAVIDSKRGEYFVCQKGRDTPHMLSPEAFAAFAASHAHCARVIEPELFKIFPDETYDPSRLLAVLMRLTGVPVDTFTPAYFFDPVYKKTNHQL
jgi:tRNA A37 threonylcarbamoyladenosine modification protein TsaB